MLDVVLVMMDEVKALQMFYKIVRHCLCIMFLKFKKVKKKKEVTSLEHFLAKKSEM